MDPLTRFTRLKLETNPFEVPDDPALAAPARLSPQTIAAFYRACVDRVSTGPAGRFALMPEALHRLVNLVQSDPYRLERILYQAFEGLVRDEPVEEKAIERGYASFLLEEQESALVRGRPPALK